ncbi:hypothetical protein [Thalassotalea euphylliae]|uniref:Glycosyltransferase n=1 Tax=Thalassotalea euphylliae TaxID=1655234 RepID=A0A3E0UD35_9GAMM|nr:hypothetical protein [Thalassotalea euphylliae]REL34908.1 hypothetical protein DXX92_05755 [Thalassotalea euphylliae]
MTTTPLFKTVIPSKIFESMGMGLPMLAAIPKGEASHIIERANAGIVCKPENSELLVEHILSLSKSSDLMKDLQLNSFKSASNYDRKTLAMSMLNKLSLL